MKKLVILGILLIWFSTSTGFSQDSVKVIQTPFTKGRSLVAMGGSINSGTSDRIGLVTDSKKFINQYSFDINLSKVVARNFIIGLKFSTERTETEQIVDSQSEMLTLGPVTRVYLATNYSGGFFLQGGLLFVNYFERNTLFGNFQVIDESIEGLGYAGFIGLGYTYVMHNRVGFEVGFNYRISTIYAEFFDHIGPVSDFQTFTRADIMFNFGFIILFNKIKKK